MKDKKNTLIDKRTINATICNQLLIAGVLTNVSCSSVRVSTQYTILIRILFGSLELEQKTEPF